MHDTDEAWGAVATAPQDGLTPRLRELRDGATDPVSPRVRERRQANIAIIESELAELSDLITDLDRYREHAVNAHTVNRVTVVAMDRLIVQRQTSMRDRGRRLRTALEALRSQP